MIFKSAANVFPLPIGKGKKGTLKSLSTAISALQTVEMSPSPPATRITSNSFFTKLSEIKEYVSSMDLVSKKTGNSTDIFFISANNCDVFLNSFRLPIFGV